MKDKRHKTMLQASACRSLTEADVVGNLPHTYEWRVAYLQTTHFLEIISNPL